MVASRSGRPCLSPPPRGPPDVCHRRSRHRSGGEHRHHHGSRPTGLVPTQQPGDFERCVESARGRHSEPTRTSRLRAVGWSAASGSALFPRSCGRERPPGPPNCSARASAWLVARSDIVVSGSNPTGPLDPPRHVMAANGLISLTWTSSGPDPKAAGGGRTGRAGTPTEVRRRGANGPCRSRSFPQPLGWSPVVSPAARAQLHRTLEANHILSHHRWWFRGNPSFAAGPT